MAFDALTVAHHLVRSLRAPLVALRRHDRSLHKQLREAGTSVPLNVAEGNRRRGGDRTYHFRVAAGSADETRQILLTAVSLGYLDESVVADALGFADRECAILWRLTERKSPPSIAATSSS